MTLLYFAPVPWDSYAQRAHYFVRHFLQASGRSVIWIDPYPLRLPVWRDLGRLGASAWATPRPVNFTVITLSAAPIEPLPGGRWLNRLLLWGVLKKRLAPLIANRAIGIAIGRPSVLALEGLKFLQPTWSVYDAMDDFPEFYRGWSRKSVDDLERTIAGRVDVILTTSAGLWKKFDAHGNKRVMVRNAFEMSSLPPAAPRSPNGRVFGYIGCVGDWFDWSIVEGLARAAPEANIQIVGPRTATPRQLPPNIALLPACPHQEGVEHLQRFSVGLIPFKKTRLTDAVDPIKYYAYRAMGLPVLTTRFGGMIEHAGAPGTYFLDETVNLAATAADALGERLDPVAINRFRSEHDWDRRFTDAGLFDSVLPS